MHRWVHLTLGVLLAGAALAGRASAAPADHVVGTGPGTCDDAAFGAATASGGLVTFNCGGPATLALTNPRIINVPITIDGGGIITLTGSSGTHFFTVGPSSIFHLENIKLTQFGGGEGGVITNEAGQLILDNVQMLQNHASLRGGAISTTGEVIIRDSSLTSNQAPSGGAIYANGSNASVSLQDSQVTFNQATDATDGQGGAVLLYAGAQLSVSGGALSNNSATGLGGAIYMDGNSSVTLDDAGGAGTTLASNTAGEAGGAVYNISGSVVAQGADFELNRTLTTTYNLGQGGAIADYDRLVLNDSQFSHNQAQWGGAVYVTSAQVAASAGLTHTLFYSNTAAHYGGGLFADVLSTTVTLADDQFDANFADYGGGLARTKAHLSLSKSSVTNNSANHGGGLYVQDSPGPASAGYVEIQDTTISSNQAPGQDGGVLNIALLDLHSVTLKANHSGVYDASGATTRLQSTVLDNGPGTNCGGDAPASGGSNFATDNTCGLSGFNDTQGTNEFAKLGPLAHETGVFTLFHLPDSDSPLIGTGGPGCAASDQRYALRVGACDIGAIEFGGLLPRLFVPLVKR